MIMSTQHGHAYPMPALPIDVEAMAKPARRGWLMAIERLSDKLRRRRQLQALVELDDRLLADIGSTREQAVRAAGRDDRALSIALRGGANQ